MTEQTWLGCSSPMDMLTLLREDVSPSRRKLRLFAVACCRVIWEELPSVRSRRAVEMAEAYADGLISSQEMTQAGRSASAAASAKNWPAEYLAARATALCDDLIWSAVSESRVVVSPESQCHLLREIFGNPFRLPGIDRAWLTPTVKAVAEDIYVGRRFEEMPVLGDALEEDGCNREDILAHCRAPSAHVRGCWVLDLVLGK